MEHVVEFSTEANNKDSASQTRRERYLARLKSLKNKFHSDSNDVMEDEDPHSIWYWKGDNSYKLDFMSRDMYEAARDGNVDAFVDLLEALCAQKKAPLSSKLVSKLVTPGGDSLLHVAAEFGRENIAELITSAFPEFDLTITNNKGDTPLHVAARARSLQVMNVILSQYFEHSQNPRNVSGSSQQAVRITKRENCYGRTPLHEAVMSKHYDGISLLLSFDEDVAHHVGKFYAPSPLYMAVETGDVKILNLLLPIPFPSERPSPIVTENSPLHAAILCRNSAMLEDIVQKLPVLMDLRDQDGGSALHFAAHTGYVEGVRILLKQPTLDAFKFNKEMNSPIHIACKMGHLDVVKELLQHEWPDPKILLNKKGENILHIAAKNGKNHVVKYLLRNPKIDVAMVNARDNDGKSPLHLASENFCLWTLLALSQDKRVDVNSIHNGGLTARDIVWLTSSIPKTRQQFLCEVILARAAVPLKANMFHTGETRVKNEDWNVKKASNTLILVAILIATVTFAAAFTIPGGVYSSDEADPRKRGMVVLAHETLFKIFMVFNMVAMYSSTLGSVILLWVQLGDRRFAEGAYGLAKFFVYLALITMPVAFLAAIRLVVSNNFLLADVVTVIGLIFIFFILFVRILGRFHLGTRLPFFRHIGELFIRIILVLFYGRYDVLIGKESNVSPPQGGNSGGLTYLLYD